MSTLSRITGYYHRIEGLVWQQSCKADRAFDTPSNEKVALIFGSYRPEGDRRAQRHSREQSLQVVLNNVICGNVIAKLVDPFRERHTRANGYNGGRAADGSSPPDPRTVER